MSKMFSLAANWGWRSDNPVKGIERFHEERRERWLSDDELGPDLGRPCRPTPMSALPMPCGFSFSPVHGSARSSRRAGRTLMLACGAPQGRLFTGLIGGSRRRVFASAVFRADLGRPAVDRGGMPTAADIAVISAAPAPRARLKRVVPPGSFAELS